MTSREREIFGLLLEGVSPKEIANRLNVSYSTVDFHRTKLYNKLGVHSIKELFNKYSTNGKAVPVEHETALPASGAKKHKRFKLLLPVGIVLLAFSVLFIWKFIIKLSANAKPSGSIIPIHNMSFCAASDVDKGGNSASEIFVTQEKIDGALIDSVLNIKTNLVKRDSYDNYAQAYTHRYDIIQQLRQANGIRFKALGDGKPWAVEFPTIETTQERKYACYTYMINTVRNKVIVVDIPYSSLYLPEWWGQYWFDFNKETIKSLSITANASQGYGSAFLQVFDFEIY